MKQIGNWNELNKDNELVESPKLQAGPQCAQIKEVKDVADKEYLEIKFDIVKGDFKGEAERQLKAFGNYPNQFIIRKSYKQTADKFFRAFITAIEKSNKGYIWNWDEKTLVGKYFVAVFGEEEYVNSSNEVKVSLKCVSERSIEALQKGEIKTPEIKKLKVQPQQAVEVFPEADFDDANLPF